MNLAKLAIDRKIAMYFFVVVLFTGGIFSFFRLGQLEDPEFTIKTAIVLTPYPGASPEEVELEVTDRIEKAVQEMPELDNLYSLSRAGMSIIKIDVKEEYWADRLPQVWDDMRKKIRDIIPQLPPGAGKPEINDDFSFVYGFVLALSGEGYSDAELETAADELKKELSLVSGIARVELWGVQEKVIYLDVSEKQLALLGLSTADIVNTLSRQNMVVDAGAIDTQDERLRVAPSGEFNTPEDIGDLLVHARRDRLAVGEEWVRNSRSGELIRIRDIASVRRGYREPPGTMMRFNGKASIGIAIANVAGSNVVDTGKALDRRLADLRADLPAGIEVHKISWQGSLVTKSINNFMVNLAESVIIVLLVMTLAMGWRMGLIIGIDLLLTILGSFIYMAVAGIELQRVSLGALIIAMGMMVDNAIVVADGFVVRLQQGMNRFEAAVGAAAQTAWPLLGATVVAIMAFYPIGGNKTNGGEFGQTLFVIIAVSLLLSWVLAMTVTPIQCLDFLPQSSFEKQGRDPLNGRFFRMFRKLLALAIRRRWLTIGVMAALLAASIVGFGKVPQEFFPKASRSQFMVDYWAPEGMRIQQVSTDLRAIESKLLEDRRVAAVSVFIGGGPPRFYLPVDPEKPCQSYAQLIVNTHTVKDIDPLTDEIECWLKAHVPQVMTRVRNYSVGPSDTWQFEARFIGSGDVDLSYLRSLGEKGMAILKKCPLAKEIQTDMRQRVKKVVPVYAQERGRWAGISREDIARTTKRAHDGLQVGLYRERDDLYPILLRQVQEERRRVAGNFDALQVQPDMSAGSVPLSQVTHAIRLEWEDPIIVRWNRRRAVTVQCAPNGCTFPTLRAAVFDDFKAIEEKLPQGYELFWDGEYDSSKDATEALIPPIIPALTIMIVIIMALFNARRPPVIIFLTIPFAVIGITAGFLGTGAAFGFMSILGALSLTGMMIKNAVVLLDQVKINLTEGFSFYDAVMEAAVSRLRPVVLASGTTVLGVIPLLWDPFWVAMSVTIMGGLAFGTVLTMIVVPVLYAILYRVPSPEIIRNQNEIAK